MLHTLRPFGHLLEHQPDAARAVDFEAGPRQSMTRGTLHRLSPTYHQPPLVMLLQVLEYAAEMESAVYYGREPGLAVQTEPVLLVVTKFHLGFPNVHLMVVICLQSRTWGVPGVLWAGHGMSLEQRWRLVTLIQGLYRVHSNLRSSPRHAVVLHCQSVWVENCSVLPWMVLLQDCVSHLRRSWRA